MSEQGSKHCIPRATQLFVEYINTHLSYACLAASNPLHWQMKTAGVAQLKN